MKKKKFLDGTGLDSHNESATKKVTAPGGAATGGVGLDDDALASVTGGRTIARVICDATDCSVSLACGDATFLMRFASGEAARAAEMRGLLWWTKMFRIVP